MGRKKRRGIELKPFCYYCDREFDDEKVLIQHQKAKHFKCTECNRKLDTAAGLVVHLSQVHKEVLTKVPNALSGRDELDVIVHGMDGIPHAMIAEKQSKLKEKSGIQDAAKQQRVQWATVGVAPNMDGYMQSTHGVPMMNAYGNNMMSFSQPMMMGMGEGYPMMMPSNYGGATNTINMQTAASSMQHTLSAATARPMMHTMQRGLPSPPPSLAPPGTSPPLQLPTSQGGAVTSAGPTRLPNTSHPPYDSTSEIKSSTVFIGTQKLLSNGFTINAAATQPTANTAPWPSNLKLFYSDDMVSPEEKRAMLEFGYDPKLPQISVGAAHA